MVLASQFPMNPQSPTDWQTVDTHLRGLARRRASLAAEEALLLRKAEQLRVWYRLGYPSMLAYLEDVLGYAPRAAFERLRVARALEVLPATTRALSDGCVSFSAVRELSRVATPHTEDAWLSAIRGRNLRDIEELVVGREPGDLPDDPRKAHLVLRKVLFELAPDAFALLRQARTALENELGHLDDDAFVTALCRRALEPASQERALHQIAVTVCETCKRGWQEGGGRNIDLSEVDIERAECDAEH